MNIRMIHKKKFIISICAIVMIAIAIPFISSYLTAKKTKAEEEIGTKIALAVTYLEQEGYIEETGNYTVYGTEKHYQTKENGNIPVSVEELVAEAPSDKTYAINEEKDLLALMILSTQTDLEGYTFSVDQKTGVTSTTSYSVKNEAYGFVGISPIAEHPFKGTFMMKFKDIEFNSNTPLFYYLDATATINGTSYYPYTIKITDACAGLARVLTYDGDGSDITIGSNSYKYITITGAVVNSDGTAGSVFADIQNSSSGKLIINDIGVTNNITSVSGNCAGGFAGAVSGNVELHLGSTYLSAKEVEGQEYAGGIVGKIEGTDTVKAKIVLEETISMKNSVSAKKGAAGGIAGYARDAEIEANTGIKLTQRNLKGQTYAGGIAGYLGNSIFSYGDFTMDIKIEQNDPSGEDTVYYAGGVCGYADASDIQPSDDSKYLTMIRPVIRAGKTKGGQYVGGVVGYIANGTDNGSLKNIKIFDVELQAKSTTATTYLGGLVGCMSDTGVDVSSCLVENVYVSNGSCFGGIIGRNEKDGLSVSYVSVKFLTAKHDNGDKVNSGRAWYVGQTGGIIGYTMTDCSISNAYDMMVSTYSADSSVANDKSIRTNLLGGLIAQAGDDTHRITVNVSNIAYADLDYNYLSSYESSAVTSDSADQIGSVTIGGIVGELSQGSVLCMDGTIDLSKVKNAYEDKSNGGVTAAYYEYYGYVVGKQTDALVYMNPTGADETGYIYGLKLPETKYADEIGNYGAVYRNGKWDVTEYAKTRDMSTENWMVEGKTHGKVQLNHTTNVSSLSTIGDFMLISIACNSGGQYGLSNLGVDTTEELLKKTYQLTSDIDLTGTNILTLNRNTLDEADYFCGTFDGGNHTITFDISVFYQPNIGLFSSVKNAVFQNLNVAGTLTVLDKTVESNQQAVRAVNIKKKNAGGLAACAYGNLTVNNVTLNQMVIRDSKDSSYMKVSGRVFREYYGGLVGYYEPDQTNHSCNISTIDCTVDILHSGLSHYVGGIIGYVQTESLTETDPMSLNLTGITLSGGIQIYTTSQPQQIQIGGVIAGIGDEPVEKQQIGVSNKEKEQNAKASCQARVKLKVTDSIVMSGFSISGNLNWIITDLGGLIGYIWEHTDSEIANITIQSDESRASGIMFQARKTEYGGLWNTVYGHMELGAVSISDTIFDVDSQKDHNAFLIQNGQYLYLELGNYKLTNVTLTNSESKMFDEIVGVSKGMMTNSSADTGGIVSIKTANEFELYQNQVVQQKNSSTRYYYNLGDDLVDIAEISGAVTIDSVGDLLQWHLSHYANEALRKYFKAENYSTTSETVTFKEVDLGDASYYPTNVSSGTYHSENSRLTFHGKEFYPSSNLLNPYDANSQNYQIQSGLFGNVTTSHITGIKLSGSVTAFEAGSGGLVSGCISGIVESESNGVKTYSKTATEISGITLSGLKVYHPNGDSWDGYYGLLVYQIMDGANVNFDQIRMTDYTGASHVAAALIGQVGDEDAEAINLKFTNMDIADVKDGVSAPNSHEQDQILAYASFIYEYNYSVDTTALNSSYGLYTFYLLDYVYGTGIRTDAMPDTTKGMVTLGEEIGETVQFYDENLTTPIASYTENSFLFNAVNYKPYVYKVKKIEVNPKAGHILEGCGTYKDPYIIENTNQFLSLYQYISNHEQYHSNLKKWKINQYGADEEDITKCTTHNQMEYLDTASYDEAAYQTKISEGFPTVKQLSEAYYLIKGDIDLTAVEDFTGFGTDKIPFTGVFIGDIPSDSSQGQYMITLPKKTEAMETFGLIQYAKGAVVQNLKILLPDEKDSMITIKSQGYGAAVMGCILGGDNVIANVTVSGTIAAQSNTSEIGGYVGRVQLGCLILREMKADSLKFFSVTKGSSDDVALDYDFVAGIAGAVEDGFVAEDDGSIVNYQNYAGLAQSPYRGVVKKEVMNRAQIVEVTQNNELSVTLDTAEDILVLSLALNSGALNYDGNQGTDQSSSFGYDYASKCRNTDYSYVGKVNDGNKDAYLNAVYYDNQKECKKTTGNTYGDIFYKPYIYQYFTFTDTPIVSGSGSNYVSQLNVRGKTIVYHLAAGDYHLEQDGIKECFKGIGAKDYNIWSGYCLIGDFVGAGSDQSTITLGIEVDACNKTVAYAGLFNRLCSDIGTTYQIGGFCLTGNVSNTSSVNSTAAGLAAYVNTPYKFSDIKARELNVSSTTNAASAFVGYNEMNLEFVNCSIVNGSSNVYEIKSNSHVGGFVGNSVGGNLSFSECNITNRERNSYHFTSTSGNVGGFIGNASSTGPTLTFENCNITNLAADSKKNYTGGFVGWTESVLKVNTNGTNTTEIRGLEIHNERPNVEQHFSVGGIVGKTRNSVEAGKISLVDSVLEFVKIEGGNTNNTYIGGIVGWAEGWSAQSQTVHAWDIVIGSESAEETLALKSIQNESNGYGNAAIGGIIGGLNISARLENCQLLGYSNSDDYTTNLTDGSWIGGMVGWIEAGSGSVTLVNPQVKNIFMELRRDWDQSNTNLVGAAGGFIGQTGEGSATVDISLAIVANLKIVNKHSDDFIMPQGGMIGYVKCPVTITDFGISGLNLGSDGYCAEAGGIAGRIVSSDNGGRISVGNSGDYPYNLIQDSVISAQVSGGIFAQSSSTGVSDIKNVKLSNVSVIARKINETNSTAAYAGGVAGDIVSDAPNNYENISIENSVIAGYPINQNTQDIYIGGVVGGREKEAAEEHFNQITLHNVLIGLMTDNLAQIPTYENVINKSVSLFTTIGDASGQKRLSKEDTSNIVDPQYTLRMGMFAGKNLSGNNTYIINAKVEYDEDTVCYRPASDVGTVKIFTAMEDVYEDYRDKYHIIYSDYMTTDKADLEDIQDIWDNHVYQNQQDSDNNDYRMEVSYGQSNVAYEDIKNIYQSTCRDSQGWVSTLQDADGNTIPVIVVSEWSYDVNALINTYLNLITNNGGAVNSGIQSIVDVTIERKQLIDGVSSDATATKIISYKNGSFAVTKGYDEYKDEKNATYTLVTVSYLYGDNAVCTVSLPIFVKEMLTLETHIKYMEGAQYSLEDVPTSDLCSAFKASVEHQSKYTIYSEFVYSSVRENLTDVTLKKSICMKDNKNAQKQFYAGTKLTLIDVSGGGKVYYYTVEKGKTKSEIAFADFKDVDGNSYVDVNMGKDSLTEYPSVDYTDVCGHVHTSVGVEKFLIIIDETGTTETANEINRIIVKPLARDNPTMQRNVNYSPVCYVELTEIAGLLKVLSPNYENYSDSAELEEVKEKYNKITDSKNFNSKSEKKDEMEFGQENKISSDSTVSMSGSLYVVSPSVLDTANISDYWQAVRTSTKPRYLEIAISLRDSSGKRVSIPNGTKVIFDHNDSDYYYTNNDSGYIYYYQYSQNETPNITKLTENTWFNFSVELDFSGADLSKVNTETYRVYVELYEYTKDDMPQSGKTIDMVYDSVQGESKKQLGFVLHTDESITLGMNGRYGDITDRGLVSFRTQLDFSDYIDTHSDSDLSQYLGKYYTYTFVIKRKEKETDGVLYQYVTDDSLSDLINVYYGSLESLPDLEDVLLTDESRVVQYTKQYTDEEIKNGTVEESFSLYADVQQLAAAGKNEYFTNYSVTCYVTISEQNPASDSGITVDSLVNTAQVNDFFVFTVANIKTDME